MYCPKCGTQNPDTANNCAHCGAPLQQAAARLAGRTPAPSTSAPRYSAQPNTAPFAASRTAGGQVSVAGLIAIAPGIVFILLSFLPWIDIANAASGGAVGMARDFADAATSFLVGTSTASIWDFAQIGGRIDSLSWSWSGNSNTYQIFFTILFVAFLVVAALIVAGAVRRMMTGKRGLLGAGYLLAAVFCAVCVFFFVLNNLGGNSVVIFLALLLSIGGFVANIALAQN